jgi:CHAD domain-containing protein
MPEKILEAEQRRQLEALLKEDLSESEHKRAKLLLLLDDGVGTAEAAREVGLSAGRARHWRSSFHSEGMQIFHRDEQEAVFAIEESQVPVEAALQVNLAPVEVAAPSTDASIKPSLDEFTVAVADLKSPGVQPDDVLAEAGRKVMRFHFAQMLRHEDGTRLGEDIEELHDMRVATRRMRAAFEVFEDAFNPKAIKPLLKGLRATGRSLGRVRDLDVFIEKAEHYLETLSPERHSELQPLLQNWAKERELDREEMVAYLDDQKYARFKQDFFRFATTPGVGVRRNPGTGFAPSRVRDIAPVLIYARIASVRAFDAILETASLEQFHALRIEFKKLRYSVEFFREVLGEESKAVIDDLKRIQDHLGDLNDAQVATGILGDFLIEWDRQQNSLPVSQRRSPEPILAYLTYRYNERLRLMQTFKTAWAHFNRPEFQQNLALAVSAL